jgi:hypothetical protein
MPSKYINGFEVIKELDIEDFELVELVKNESVQPFNQDGIKVLDIKKQWNFYYSKDEYTLYCKIFHLQEMLEEEFFYEAQGLKEKKYDLLPEINTLWTEINQLKIKGVQPINPTIFEPEEFRKCQ